MADARRPPAPQRPRTGPDPLDGVELTDDDLDVVVGGLSPEASMAYVSYLRDAAGRRDPAARIDWLRSSAVLWRRD